jgi:hypothetical protein
MYADGPDTGARELGILGESPLITFTHRVWSTVCGAVENYPEDRGYSRTIVQNSTTLSNRRLKSQSDDIDDDLRTID